MFCVAQAAAPRAVRGLKFLLESGIELGVLALIESVAPDTEGDERDIIAAGAVHCADGRSDVA